MHPSVASRDSTLSQLEIGRYKIPNSTEDKVVIIDAKTRQMHRVEETKIPEFVREYLSQHQDLSEFDVKSLLSETDFKILIPSSPPALKKIFASLSLEDKFQFLQLTAALQSRKIQPTLHYLEDIARKISTGQKVYITKKAKTVHWDTEICESFQKLSIANDPASHLQAIFAKSLGIKYRIPVKSELRQAFKQTLEDFTQSIKDGYLDVDDVMEEFSTNILIIAKKSDRKITSTINEIMKKMFSELNDYFTSVSNDNSV